MKTVLGLLSQCRRSGIRLWVENRDLCFKAPKGALSSDLRAGLAAHKAEVIAILAQAHREQKIPTIEPAPRPAGQPLPVSFSQQRLWFQDRFEGPDRTYNMFTASRLNGWLNVAVLEMCLLEIARRHETLRSRFVEKEGRPFVVIDGHVGLQVVDVQNDRDWERLIPEEIRRPFDLCRGPLVRFTLLRQGPVRHILIAVMHHIISDGWSVGVLVREMAVLYTAFNSGTPSPFPELPIQFTDYVHWQRARFGNAARQTELLYWKQRLTGIPRLLELPTDRPRPRVRSNRGSSEPFEIGGALTRELNGLCHHLVSLGNHHSEITLFMVLQAAFVLLLSRYSGQDDIVLGTVVANRNHREIEPLIGFFVNTLVLRAGPRESQQLWKGGSFLDLLARIRATTLEAYAHQETPFDLVVDALAPERDLSHTPLFQVMFVLQNTPLEAMSLPGIELEPITFLEEAAQLDLNLSLMETRAGLQGTMTFATDLFEATTIRRMIDHFTNLLDAVSSMPDQPLRRITLTSPEERKTLLDDWNRTQAPYPADRCLHQLIEDRAGKNPETIALQTAARALGQPSDQRAFYEELTYFHMNEKANRLAHQLVRLGVGPETLVGICCEREPLLVVGILAILKAGGAYVPLDPALPKGRMAHILRDARVRVLLTRERLVPELPRFEGNLIRIDRIWKETSAHSSENSPCGVLPENPVYAMFTSGSTGAPKGILVPHRGLVSYLHNTARQSSMRGGRGSALALSIGFDASAGTLWLPLIKGKISALVPNDWEIEKLVPLFDAGFSFLDLSPAHLDALVPRLRVQGRRIRLNRLWTGGEALTAETVKPLQELAPDIDFINEYGPTETVVGSTRHIMAAGAPVTNPIPIGRPMENTRIYIVNPFLLLAGIGVPGEIGIDNPSMARGYLNLPDLTAEKFVPHPFAAMPGDAPGQRLYRSGDLGRYRPDGAILFMGRLDDQVKLRGFRIEPREIEAVLQRLPDIADALVLLKGNPKRLVAYLTRKDPSSVTEPGINLDGERYRAALKESLPDYMVPSLFIGLKAFPLTPNGKIDRDALPDPVHALETRVYSPPRSPEERKLAVIWKRVLGVAEVGLQDRFFELGGDSILSLQVVAQASEAGLPLTPKQLFEHQTLESLAAHVGHAHPNLTSSEEVTGSAPLTPIQRHFFEEGPSHHFNQSLLLWTAPHLSPDILSRAVKSLLSHHDALRLSIQGSNSGRRQHYAPMPSPIPFKTADLNGIPPKNREKELITHATEVQTSLDYERGPLARFVLYRFGNGEPGRLLIVIHHLAVDGVSWRILLEDLDAACQSIMAEQPARLPPKTTSYLKWSRRLTAYAQSDTLAAERNYWLALEQVPATSFPRDREPEGTPDINLVSFTLTRVETRTLLTEAAKAHGARIDELILTALAPAFASRTGQSTFLIDIDGYGRAPVFEDVDLSRTVGWFTAVYPLRVTAGSGLLETLPLVKARMRKVPHQGIGFGILSYLTAKEEIRARLAAIPKPSIQLNYLGRFDRVPRSDLFPGGAKSPGPDWDPRIPLFHPWEVSAMIASNVFQIDVTFDRKAYRTATARSFLEDIGANLRELIQLAPIRSGSRRPGRVDRAPIIGEKDG